MQITLKKTKDCKHSVRFDVDKDVKNPLITSIYITRPAADHWKEVKVTVEGFG